MVFLTISKIFCLRKGGGGPPLWLDRWCVCARVCASTYTHECLSQLGGGRGQRGGGGDLRHWYRVCDNLAHIAGVQLQTQTNEQTRERERESGVEL